jgi:nicotinamidase-related amidase
MHLKITDRPALILIDIQKGFDEQDYWGGQRNNPDAETNAHKLLNFWRNRKLPVFHVKHSSVNPASPLAAGKAGHEIKNEVNPATGEPVTTKNVHSAFIGTDLKQQLENASIQKIVIAGLTTDHCISTTVRMGSDLGFDTYLVYDATATFPKKGIGGKLYPAQLVHDTAIASLIGEFTTVVATQELLDGSICSQVTG